MRRNFVFIVFLFMMLFSFYDVSALKSTSSTLKNRNVCEKFEVALANSDDSITSVGCYNSYDAAKNAMDNHESDAAIILERVSGKTLVIDAKYALVYLDRGEVVTNLYTSSNLASAYTYMNNSSSYGGPDAAFIKINYNNNKSAKIKISGVTGWVARSNYTLIPLNWVKSSSYYKNNGESIVHYYAKNIENSGYTRLSRTLGPKLEYLNDIKYYSYDGKYFYETLKDMLKDYKDSSFENSVNKDNPYYNYYMYLPHRSKTTYSIDDVDVYIRNVMNYKGGIYSPNTTSNRSVLYGQSDFFFTSQETYGANALSVFSLARNESANGRSSIAINKNNIFGHAAYDSSPYASASGYLNVRNSIFNHAYSYINYGYSEVADSRYFGGHFGNKGMGMNVKYASDPYWGEKAASFYYSFDKDNGLSDYNYYQLGITTIEDLNARSGPGTSYSKIYAYKEKNVPLIILESVEGTEVNGSKIWYKVQADSNLNNANTSVVGSNSSLPSYNWDSSVYVHSSYVNLINDAKNEDGSFNKPKDVNILNNFSYKQYATDDKYTPIVGRLKEDTDYYYSSTLTNKKGTALKESYVVIIEEAKSENEVKYLIVTDYQKFDKSWISGENIEIVSKDLLGYVEDEVGSYVNLYDKINGNDIGNIYTKNYLPIMDKKEEAGNIWVKVQISLNPIEYGYIKIDNDVMTYTFDNLNAHPTILASDLVIMLNEEYDLMDGVKGTDKEDGDITDKIIIKEDNIDNTEVGIYTVTYSLTDTYGNTTYKTIEVIVVDFIEKDALFMYDNLEHKEKNIFNIRGFLGVKGMDNKDVVHSVVFVNQVTELAYPYLLDNWQEYPYEMSSLDDKKAYDYSGGWFNSDIDLTDLPSGDYTIYVNVINGEYTSTALFTNIAYLNMTRRASFEDRGYAIDIDYTSSGSPLVFSVRDNNLLSNDTPSTTDPMYNFFTNVALNENELTLKGTSHSVGVDLSKDKEVKRELIFENTTTYERFSFDLGSITNGDYEITLAVSDNCDKTRAWYDNKVNLETLAKGTYVLYIKNTVDGKSFYGELIDIAYTNFDNINNSRYTFKRINERRLRVELTVN